MAALAATTTYEDYCRSFDEVLGENPLFIPYYIFRCHHRSVYWAGTVLAHIDGGMFCCHPYAGQMECLWVGWPGTDVEPGRQNSLMEQLKEYRLVPIFLVSYFPTLMLCKLCQPLFFYVPVNLFIILSLPFRKCLNFLELLYFIPMYATRGVYPNKAVICDRSGTVEGGHYSFSFQSVPYMTTSSG